MEPLHSVLYNPPDPSNSPKSALSNKSDQFSQVTQYGRNKGTYRVSVMVGIFITYLLHSQPWPVTLPVLLS